MGTEACAREFFLRYLTVSGCTEARGAHNLLEPDNRDSVDVMVRLYIIIPDNRDCRYGEISVIEMCKQETYLSRRDGTTEGEDASRTECMYADHVSEYPIRDIRCKSQKFPDHRRHDSVS